MNKTSLPFKPYARLLTMLGDQLIRNERVALVEIIKNAYDADASWVKVTFAGFGPKFRLVRKIRGCIPARATCQVNDRARVRGRGRCETHRIFSS